ncbi:MAG: hypothetical protein H7A35_05310 [Planctomycetales bacterium]|nr:hypothetical protein [bacterium]UNM09475.1 MAG: hypothetical protein H7A35_05310 [Planctomycetales bacterium]
MRKMTILWLLGAVLLYGCSATGDGRPAVHGPAAGGNTLPALDVLRGSMVLQTLPVRGNQTYLRSPGATDDGSTLLLDSAAASEWAIYELSLHSSEITGINVKIDNASGEGLWLALPDYETGRWLFSGPHTDDVMDLQPSKLMYSGTEQLYIALLAAPGNSAYIDGFELSHENGWQFNETGVALSSGGYSRMAALEVAGNPALAFLDDNGSTAFLRADGNGFGQSDWGEPTVLEEAAGGEWLDMALIGGNPALSYHSGNDKKLRYVRCGIADGTDGWGKSVNVASFTDHAPLHSLAEVDGKPAICFIGEQADLLYVRSLSAEGGTDDDWDKKAALAVLGPGYVLGCPSLSIVDGNPAVAWYLSNPQQPLLSSQVLYMRSSSVDGVLSHDWPEQAVVAADDLEAMQAMPTLRFFAGSPVIGFHAADDDLLVSLSYGRYVRASTSGGELAADWSEGALIEPGELSYPRMELVGSRLLLLGVDAFGGKLQLADCGTPQPQEPLGWQDVQLNGNAGGFGSPVLFELNGNPAVFYRRTDDGQIIFGTIAPQVPPLPMP